MNYYIWCDSKYYCLNPINKDSEYSYLPLDTGVYLFSVLDKTLNPLHRLDGPAIEYWVGTKKWFYHGQEIHCKSQKEFEKIIKMKAFL